jgi:copper oxidase (laccase) domain-containing protein
MPSYVISILTARGVSHDAIVVDPWCTWTHTDKFRGWRRWDKTERNFVGVRRCLIK